MLAIGRALMTNPRVLLLDEPSEGLAPRVIHELGLAMQRLKTEGLSILLVEQNSALALDIADDAVVLGAPLWIFGGLRTRSGTTQICLIAFSASDNPC